MDFDGKVDTDCWTSFGDVMSAAVMVLTQFVQKHSAFYYKKKRRQEYLDKKTPF